MKQFIRTTGLAMLTSGWLLASASAATPVTLLRTPQGGIQPQAVVDETGSVHLIYLKGDPAASDIYYVRQEPLREPTTPLRVNSQAGSAIAIGTIRGAQLALGKNGRLHVAWNGSQSAEPKPKQGVPMLYARMNDSRADFEPQRNLMAFATGLDGGGSVAADSRGNVYVAWHASPTGTSGEENRAVFVARSSDECKTFDREIQANSQPTGACGCCGLRAFADRQGNFFALYRAAGGKLNRDLMLLTSRDHGARFETATLHTWKISTCPMSSASLTASGLRVLAAWETAGQVYFTGIDSATGKFAPPLAAPGAGKRKHPVVVGNRQGDILLAWTEGTAWQKGGSLAWQVFDQHGQATGEQGVREGVPVWGLVSALARPDGGFTIVY